MAKKKSTKVNEASVELKFILPLLNRLGYEPTDIAPKYSIIFQEGRRGRPHEADYVIFAGPIHNAKTSLIVVEAKAPNESFDKAKSQAESYAANIKTPFTVLSDGVDLQIWQLQPSSESELIFSTKVSDIEAEFGKLESFLRKDAVVEFSKALAHKSILSASIDFGPFETAEAARAGRVGIFVGRTLIDKLSNEHIKSDDIIILMKRGAIIVGASGFGKTALSYALVLKAIEQRWEDNRCPLPFHVSLEDVKNGESILDFLLERLRPHKPGQTKNTIEELLRNIGAILLCDGFDRVDPQTQDRIQSDIRNILRDFPLVQAFVFSRASAQPQLSLPVVALQGLTAEQQREFVKALPYEKGQIFLSAFPLLLQGLCENPLLLKLTLEYCESRGELPTQLQQLFQGWLDVALRKDARFPSIGEEHERALRVIAVARSIGPMSLSDAIRQVEANGISRDVFDDLIQRGVLKLEAAFVYFEHEALSDYLHAIDISLKPEAEIFDRLQSVRLERDSLFPVLLMGVLRSDALQNELWRRVLELDVATYIDVLRYRADMSEEMAKDDKSIFASRYLSSLRNGLEGPLVAFFPSMQRIVRKVLVGIECDSLVVHGTASPAHVQYALLPRDAEEPEVTIDDLTSASVWSGVNLPSSGLSADSGRLIGTTRLRAGLLEAVERRWLQGGVHFLSERLSGRLRLLRKEYGFVFEDAEPLTAIEERLLPNAGTLLRSPYGFRGAPFNVDDVLQDLSELRAANVTRLDHWWSDAVWKDQAYPQDETVLAALLGEHYARSQLLYRDLVKESLSSIGDQLPFYRALPVRWHINVVRRQENNARLSIDTKWLPVEGWQQAGADVHFSEQHQWLDWRNDHFISAKSQFERLGRNANMGITLGYSPMPLFDGSNLNGSFDGETSVLRSAVEMLRDDLKDLFSEMPGRYLD